MTHKVVFRGSAKADLRSLAFYIAQESGSRADAFVSRIEARCLALADFPLSGRARDDLTAGLRTVAFEGNVLIAYAVTANRIEIVRVLYGGRDERLLKV